MLTLVSKMVITALSDTMGEKAAQEGSLDQQSKCFSSDTLSKTREKPSLHTPVSGFLSLFLHAHKRGDEDRHFISAALKITTVRLGLRIESLNKT